MTAPLVAVTVKIEEPVGLFLLVEMVMVDEPEPVRDLGLNAALVRRGSPETEKLMVPLNPVPALTVTL